MEEQDIQLNVGMQVIGGVEKKMEAAWPQRICLQMH